MQSLYFFIVFKFLIGKRLLEGLSSRIGQGKNTVRNQETAGLELIQRGENSKQEQKRSCHPTLRTASH
jgi:hypothetical protein